MKRLALFVALVWIALTVSPACASPNAQKTQILCGWFENPTPGNASLRDRSGEWTVGIQGGHQAEGDWPAFRASQWVNTNRSYGHGCACIKGVVDKKNLEVVRIVSARAEALGVCRRDRALREPAS